jgi:hypothetical protein
MYDSMNSTFSPIPQPTTRTIADPLSVVFLDKTVKHTIDHLAVKTGDVVTVTAPAKPYGTTHQITFVTVNGTRAFIIEAV